MACEHDLAVGTVAVTPVDSVGRILARRTGAQLAEHHHDVVVEVVRCGCGQGSEVYLAWSCSKTWSRAIALIKSVASGIDRPSRVSGTALEGSSFIAITPEHRGTLGGHGHRSSGPSLFLTGRPERVVHPAAHHVR